MKVKICGMKEPPNISAVAALNPDYLGFIFYEKSPRCCKGIAPEEIKDLPDGIEPVMVTVDLTEDEIIAIAERYGFRTIQLHGRETPELCFSLRSRGYKVVKAMGMRSVESLETLREYEGAVDGFILDTLCPTKGGSGRKFDWNIIHAYDLDKDFCLSGGIGPGDAEALRAISHDRFAGIDLNSRFEIEPGIKDPELLSQFLNELRREI